MVQYRMKANFIQGMKDNLVDPGNAEFAKRMMTNTSVELVTKDNMNHFVPWSDPELIRNAVLKILQAKD